MKVPMNNFDIPECLGEFSTTDVGNEFECGYDTDIICEDCICSGCGWYDPRTGKLFYLKGECMEAGKTYKTAFSEMQQYSKCFIIGSLGECGLDCAAWREGECPEPQEMDLDGLSPEDLAEIYKMYPEIIWKEGL